MFEVVNIALHLGGMNFIVQREEALQQQHSSLQLTEDKLDIKGLF